MINVFDVYIDVLDLVNEPENGQLSVERFNRYSWLSQLRFIDWLSGNLDGVTMPEPYASQKSKDWLSPFITKYPKQVTKGVVPKPTDYYAFENLYLLGQYNEKVNCFETVVKNGVESNTIIEILDGAKYTQRSQTYIEGLQPSFKKPISKLVGSNLEFNPTDLGSITLEYIRYPKKSKLVMVEDTVTRDLVYDPANSIDFEWNDYARGALVWFIADMFYNRTSNQAGKQFNQASKTPNE